MFRQFYDEIHRLARRERRQFPVYTLNTTGLVHEAYLKLAQFPPHEEPSNRAQMLAIAARAMRQVLLNYVRASRRLKRGGDRLRVTFSETLAGSDASALALIEDLEEALSLLEEQAPRCARVVECRYFAGLSTEETAVALDVSVPTVSRDWAFAKAWLFRRLNAPA